MDTEDLVQDVFVEIFWGTLDRYDSGRLPQNWVSPAQREEYRKLNEERRAHWNQSQG